MSQNRPDEPSRFLKAFSDDLFICVGALINGGTFHGNKIYPPGKLLCKDIVDCFPFEDPIVVMKVAGKAIKEALENGVSDYPAKSYKFPQVSHITFSFDAHARAMERVREVRVKDEALDMEKEYTIATRAHIAAGKGT